MALEITSPGGATRPLTPGEQAEALAGIGAASAAELQQLETSLTEALAAKADVSDLAGKADAAALAAALAGKVGQAELTQALANKADAAALAAGLAGKADAAETTSALAAKADAAAVDAALAGKASITELQAGLAAKADTAAMTQALAAKADATETAAALAAKAGAAALASGLATKADASELEDIRAALGDAADINAALASKADAAETTSALAAKADTAAMTAALAGKVGAGELAAALAGKADAAAMDAALAAKADASATASALAAKADAAATTQALAGKVDVSVVDDLLAALGDASSLTEAIASKADAAETTSALAAKADAAAMTAALAGKVSHAQLDDALQAKADAAAMTAALAAKADAAALASGLAAKADAGAMTSALAAKADADAVAQDLADKADAADMAAALADKADVAAMAVALAGKADKTDTEAALANKAETAAMLASLALKADAAPTAAALDTKAPMAQVSALEGALAILQARLTVLEESGVGTGPGISGAPVLAVAPVVSGVHAVGQALQTTLGLYANEPTRHLVQWYRRPAGGEPAPIAGATALSYLLAAADTGCRISATVYPANAHGMIAAPTGETDPVVAAPTVVVAPTISGTPAPGNVLTADLGTWTGAPDLALQWMRDTTPIAGETGTTYTVVAGDVHHSVRLRVTATNLAGFVELATAALAIVAVPTMLVAPVVTGTPATGRQVIASPGSWTFSPSFAFQWYRDGEAILLATLPTYTMQVADEGHELAVRVTATNAAGSAQALSAAVTGQPPVSLLSIFANPVTHALAGDRTFNVGPGQTYPEPDTVPWGALQAGDVVNVFWRPAAYQWKVGLRGQGTQAKPIIVNGVTDSEGHRPVFDFQAAHTAPGSNPGGGNNVFSATPMYGESLGGFVVKRGPNDPYGTYAPKWLQIRNLELRGARNGGTYVDLAGGTQVYSSAAGIYLLLAEDVLLENLVITNNGFGLFTQSKDGVLSECCKRITMRRCRVYGNGVDDSFLEHGVYMQAISPVVEGCFIGRNRRLSQGSSYKSRSSGEVFRYNWVESHARALDFIHSEDSDEGVQAQADFGITHCYGNVIVNDANAEGGGAYVPIHYGGDNLGEDGAQGSLVNPSRPYRHQLYFYANTYVCRANSDQQYRVCLFDLSLAGTGSHPRTTVDAWDNVFVLIGTARWSWVEYAGRLNLRGRNHVQAQGELFAAHDQANPARYDVHQLGTLTTGAAQMVDVLAGDFSPASGSPLLDAAQGIDAGDLPASYLALPVEYSPNRQANGLLARPATGAALDLGALEIDMLTPVVLVAPAITGTPEVGETLGVSSGTWTNSPTGYAYQWLRDGTPIAGATAATYTVAVPDGGHSLAARVTATTGGRSGTATSAAVEVEASPLAPQNTVLPAITGTPQVPEMLSVSSGTWTNSPTGYGYQWLRGGTPIAGATGTTYTLVGADVGATLSVLVTASNAMGDNTATSAGVGPVAAAPSLDPDANGRWHFAADDGTLITALDPSWTASTGDIGYECVGGRLQCMAGMGWYGITASHARTPAPSTVEALVLAGGWGDGAWALSLRGGAYVVSTSGTALEVRRNGDWQASPPHGINVATTNVKLRVSMAGGRFRAWANDTLLYDEADAAPTTTGPSALAMFPGSDVTTMRMEYFDDAL